MTNTKTNEYLKLAAFLSHVVVLFEPDDKTRVREGDKLLY